MEEINKKVLNAFVKVSNENEVADYMEHLTAGKLEISEEELSVALYDLQEKGIIAGVIFDKENPKKALLWDDVAIRKPEFYS